MAPATCLPGPAPGGSSVFSMAALEAGAALAVCPCHVTVTCGVAKLLCPASAAAVWARLHPSAHCSPRISALSVATHGRNCNSMTCRPLRSWAACGAAAGWSRGALATAAQLSLNLPLFSHAGCPAELLLAAVFGPLRAACERSCATPAKAVGNGISQLQRWGYG